MNIRIGKIFGLVIISAIFFITTSCTKEITQTQQDEYQQPQAAKEEMPAPEEPESNDKSMPKPFVAEEAEGEKTDFLNRTIHFDFDSSILSHEAQEILTAQADFLINNPDERVVLEGHCDERGTDLYNLALGARRANAAKAYLLYLGIDSEQLSTISYGEEHPLLHEHSAEAWRKNRRVQFVIDQQL